MAAPSSAYSSKNLQVMKNGQIVYHNIALGLGMDLATIKARFYLDYILNTSAGYVGCCYVGGYNYQHHNTNRNGVINMFKAGTLKAYLDAGLNTLGDAVVNYPKTTFANRSKINATYKSSYYSNSSAIKVQYSINNGNWSEDFDPSNLAANTSLTKDVVINADAQKGALMRVRAVIDNEEGRYYGAEYSYVADDRINQVDFIYKSTACATDNSNNMGVWMRDADFNRLGTLTENSVADGAQAFKDDELTVPIDNGYYAGSSNKVFFAQSGRFERYQICETGGGTNPNDYDIVISCDVAEDNYASVNVSVNNVKNFDINISGRIAAYNAQGFEISGSGNGNFNFIISANSYGNGQSTGYLAPANRAYLKATFINMSPVVTYLAMES
jgi:hypothetical protein